MEKMVKIPVLLLILVLGISGILISCDKDDDGDDGGGIVNPQTVATLLNVTIVLSANTQCDGDSFCEDDGLTFQVPVTGTSVNVSMTAPANLALYVMVFDSDDSIIAVAAGSLSFTPPKIGMYQLWVSDGNEVGGTVSIVVTQ